MTTDWQSYIWVPLVGVLEYWYCQQDLGLHERDKGRRDWERGLGKEQEGMENRKKMNKRKAVRFFFFVDKIGLTVCWGSDLFSEWSPSLLHIFGLDGLSTWGQRGQSLTHFLSYSWQFDLNQLAVYYKKVVIFGGLSVEILAHSCRIRLISWHFTKSCSSLLKKSSSLCS